MACVSKPTIRVDGVTTMRCFRHHRLFSTREGTQEFRVTNFDGTAEYGGAGGAIIQSSIKSGTTSFTDRRSSVYHQILTQTPTTTLRHYGRCRSNLSRIRRAAQLGGPSGAIALPLRRYQGLRQRNRRRNLTSMPTQLMRDAISRIAGHHLTQTIITDRINSMIPTCSQYAVSLRILSGDLNPLTCLQFTTTASLTRSLLAE